MHGGGPGFESPRLHRRGCVYRRGHPSLCQCLRQCGGDQTASEAVTRPPAGWEISCEVGRRLRTRFDDLMTTATSSPRRLLGLEDLRVVGSTMSGSSADLRVCCTLTMRHAGPVGFCGRGTRAALDRAGRDPSLTSHRDRWGAGARVCSPARTAKAPYTEHTTPTRTTEDPAGVVAARRAVRPGGTIPLARAGLRSWSRRIPDGNECRISA